MTNPCLREACLSDMLQWFVDQVEMAHSHQDLAGISRTLGELYDAEWKRRGFERSP